MNKFLKNLIFFLIPVIAYLVLVYSIDPFNFFDKKSIFFSNKIKLETSYKLNYPLYELIDFDKNPTEYILLGDSRVENLGIKYFEKYSGHQFKNLAYGGGTLIESINTFWEIAQNHKIKEVYFGLNFDSYNAIRRMDRVSEAIDIKNNFLKYVFSKYTIKSIFLIIKKEVFNKVVKIGKPNQTKNEFWNYQLNITAKNSFRIYKYPKAYFLELKRITNYCKKNQIKLIFFIPPTHIDLQNKIVEYNLLEEETKFKEDLQSIGKVYDFNYKSELTEDKENFIDPFHIENKKTHLIVDDFFQKKIRYSKFYDIK